MSGAQFLLLRLSVTNRTRLVLHPGLPKTATSLLQQRFFPQVYDGYLGTSLIEPKEMFTDFFRIHNDFLEGADWSASLRDWVNRLDFSGESVQLISDEGLLRWPSPGGSGRTPLFGPHDMTPVCEPGSRELQLA